MGPDILEEQLYGNGTPRRRVHVYRENSFAAELPRLIIRGGAIVRTRDSFDFFFFFVFQYIGLCSTAFTGFATSDTDVAKREKEGHVYSSFAGFFGIFQDSC